MEKNTRYFELHYDDYDLIYESPEGVRFWRNIKSKMTLTAKESDCFNNERDILVEMMCRNFDKYHHIVKFHGSFAGSQELAFETLNIDLEEYFRTNLVTLVDIRDIIQQMATALMALKSIGVIHGNVLLKNIIMEDRRARPLRVKLGNFSAAQLKSDYRRDPELQGDKVLLQAPEMAAGQLMSEAFDMWCLGRVMSLLLLSSERCRSFVQRKEHHENNFEEDVELEEAIHLLKAMMKHEPDERITPAGVLSHPFIVRGCYPWTRQRPPAVTNEFCIDFLKLEVMQKLGQGHYGEIRKCRRTDTGELLAVKRPLRQSAAREIDVLEALMAANADQHHIVKCLGWLDFKVGKAPVLELLDRNLELIMMEQGKPMLLSDIRDIVQQMAEALLLLKDVGIVHGDIKPNNIMTVDRQRPLSIKLIDFGLARDRSELQPGLKIQVLPYRAPEVFLGLPLTEALDMWSLGCVMARMVLGTSLFIGNSAEVVVQEMVQYLGMPAKRVLDKGIYTKTFFTKPLFQKWTHKKTGNIQLPAGREFQSLDDLKTMCLEENNAVEAVEREQCIDLLKAMLQIDPDERITPQEVLQHPFINAHELASCNKPVNPRPDHHRPPLTTLAAGVNLVQPAPPKRRLTTVDSVPTVPEEMPESSASIHENPVTQDSRGTQKQGKKKKNLFLRVFSRMGKTFRL